MNTVLSWLQPYRYALTARADRWGQSSWMAKAELPVVGITVPTLVVLAAWLGIALGLPLAWNLVAVTILGLVLVSPFMLRRMLSSTLIEIDGTHSTARTSRAAVVPSYSGAPDYEGWYGPMVNFNSDELDFLSELVGLYLEENDDLSQREWGFAKGIQDKLEEALDG